MRAVAGGLEAPAQMVIIVINVVIIIVVIIKQMIFLSNCLAGDQDCLGPAQTTRQERNFIFY